MMQTSLIAIAINRGALLFTFNVRHFEGLEEMGLKMFPATER
jgi:predicted nucleic acid-binding protein